MRVSCGMATRLPLSPKSNAELKIMISGADSQHGEVQSIKDRCAYLCYHYNTFNSSSTYILGKRVKFEHLNNAWLLCWPDDLRAMVHRKLLCCMLRYLTDREVDGEI